MSETNEYIFHDDKLVPNLGHFPQTDQFSKESFDGKRILKFKLSDLRHSQVIEYLKELAGKAIVQGVPEPQVQVAELRRPASYYLKLLREEANAVHPPPIPKAWEDSICKLLPQQLLKKYPHIVVQLCEEIRQEYKICLHELGIRRILKPQRSEYSFPPVKKYFSKGKSETYHLFLKRRTVLHETLFLTHPVIRSILERSILFFPEVLIDLVNYRTIGPINQATLHAKLHNDLKKVEMGISLHWYPKLVEIIFGNKDSLADVKPEYLLRFLNCATNLISTQLTELMRRSINHIVQVVEDTSSIPLLNMEIFYEETGIELFPHFRDIFGMFHQLIDSITNIAQDLPSLEFWGDLPCHKEHISVKLTESFCDNAHALIEELVENLYRPIKEYINTLDNEFSILYDQSLVDEINEFISRDHTFHESLERINFFKSYLQRIKQMVVNIYFPVGRVCQFDIIRNLKGFACGFINDLEDNLIEMHKLESISICDVFEEIVTKANKSPESTEDLIYLGQFMDHAYNTLLGDLKERIRKQLSTLGTLLQTTLLTEDHLALNARTILWLQEIMPVFKKSSMMYEQYKFDFEENLQQKTEILNKKLEDLTPRLVLLNYMEEFDNVASYIPEIRKFLRRLQKFDAQIAWINNEETLFKFPHSTYPELDELKSIIHPFAALIFLIYKWKLKYKVWMNGAFDELVYETIEQETDEFHKKIIQMQKDYRVKIKQQSDENDPRRFHGNVDDPEFANIPAPMKLCIKTNKQIKEFKDYFIFIRILCNPALTKRQWDEMSNIVNFDITPNAGTTLKKMISLNLTPYLDKFEIISIGATKELALRQALNTMFLEWENVKFTTVYHMDSNLTIFSNFSDIQMLIDDHLIRSLIMRGSVFVKPFESDIKNWYEKLLKLSDTIKNCEIIQQKWIYYRPIFSSSEIICMIPEEFMHYQKMDEHMHTLLKMAEDGMLVTDLAQNNAILSLLKYSLRTMEELQKGIGKYLNDVQLYFPRFFFLSYDEILDIISETKYPEKIIHNLKKCFSGIYKLGVVSDFYIKYIYSEQGEEIRLQNEINVSNLGEKVEKWMYQIEEEMKTVLKYEIYNCNQEYDQCTPTEWIDKWPSQVLMCVSQIKWTSHVTEYLSKGRIYDLPEYSNLLQKHITETVLAIRGKVPNLVQIKLGALIVLHVHFKHVVDQMYNEKVSSKEDFQWLSHLRYYIQENVTVKCTNAAIMYSYEYAGSVMPLVITPLTERCYRTLINAFHMHFNGILEGPAGTGKTETVKDLARALAVHCVVFNCSEYLDYSIMSRFFRGLAMSGSWACFDEFNRINLEVLSVISQQITSISKAVQSGVKYFSFEGQTININHNCFICITMFPQSVESSHLPENLKTVFRSVAMAMPNKNLVAEIILYAGGFLNASLLSVKLMTLYSICSEQLSPRGHYEYGMRSIKAVLTAAKILKIQLPDEDEDYILKQAICDIYLPKLVSQDVPIFQGIVSDLFKCKFSLPFENDKILQFIKQVCCNFKLQHKDWFNLKIIQIHKLLMLHHGLMLIGDPFSGKTTAIKSEPPSSGQNGSQIEWHLSTRYSVLKKELWPLKIGHVNTPQHGNLYYQLKIFTETLKCFPGTGNVVCEIINPKSMTVAQLYGQEGAMKQDGIFSHIFKKFALSSTSDKKIIIFDGPVDSVWTENLNTVIDDNKKLCLPSGEIVKISPLMSIIFESENVSQVSPATISRCQMIYFESKNVDWKILVDSWILNMENPWMKGNVTLFEEMFDWLLPCSIDFVQKFGKLLINTTTLNLVQSTLSIIEMLLNDAVKSNEDCEHMKSWIQAAFLHSVVWGIAGTLDSDSREAFDDFYKTIWRGSVSESPVPPSLEKVDISIPSKGLIFDHIYNYKEKGNWIYWPEVLRNMETEEMPNIQQTLVPTVDTARYLHIMDMHIRHSVPMLLVGNSGTGKSFYFQNMLMSKLPQEKYDASVITFTSQTSANQVQALIISKLKKSRGNFFGPMKDKKCVLFIDNLNLPTAETDGAQPSIEILRQLLNHGVWYDENASKITIHDTLLVSAACPQSRSYQPICKRFLHHLSVYSINNLTEDSISKIFSTVLLISLKRNGFAADVMSSVQSIVQSTLDVYLSSVNQLHPTPLKSHYTFSLKDISKVIQGCSLVRKESADTKKFFIKLWVHENLRVFYDRLVNHDDRNWLFNKLKSCVKDYFNEQFEVALDSVQTSSGEVTEECLRNLMFGCYLNQDRKYEEIPSIDKFLHVASDALELYNSSHKTKMDIVLFRFALEHLSRISRLLVTPGANGLLVGVGGSGRQCLTKLAASLMGNELFQPEITESYEFENWREDLKNILMDCGGRNKETTCLLAESQIKKEKFLEDIDLLFNTGEIPNIFSVDEKQHILDLARLAAQGGNSNLDISADTVFTYFVNCCKQKLHIILCFSPLGMVFQRRLRQYPSFINCCTIDWFQVWPEDALEKVAQHYFQDVKLNSKTKLSIVNACKYFHVTARELSDSYFSSTRQRTYITSSAYLHLISLFKDLIKHKQEETLKVKQRYVIGLDKLQYAAEQVSALQKELSELRPQLVVAAKETAQMMIVIERETVQVEKASAQVREDEKVANKQAANAQELKNECEADLAQAIPILEDAIAALNTLKPTDITLVKSMKNPPDTVKLVMAAVCVMKDIKPDRINDAASGRKIIDYWGPSKKLLGDMYFLQSLKDFDKDNIPPTIMKKIRSEYLPNKDFKPHIVTKASSAAEGLCKWVMAMDMYDAVKKEVAPKKAKLQVAEREYNATLALLEEKRLQVRMLEEQLAELNAQLNDANKRKKLLEDEVELSTNKLARAEKLIGGLGGEKSRWLSAAEMLQRAYECLAGDVLISCGVIAYLAIFTSSYRHNCIKDWHNYLSKIDIPCSKEYNFSSVLGSEVKIQNWNILALPRDIFSIENAIIIDTTKRWSLIVDPQGQANNWIKNMEKKNGLIRIKFTDKQYMSILENCITLGKPVLLENVGEELETPLEPILRKQIIRKDDNLVLILGKKNIEYNNKFRFYLTTKLRTPHYLPEVFNKVTLVNFELTVEGLEDQLLGIVVKNERPELEETRQNLIVESAANKNSLKQVEDAILITLSQTTGNILENEAAIKVLDSSKRLSEEIISKQEAAKHTQEIIDKFRRSYEPFAHHSALLYYCLNDLSNVNPMYQFSLSWFINLYTMSHGRNLGYLSVKERLKLISDTFTYNLYTKVCRSLFENDKLLFSFLLCTNIMKSSNTIKKEELTFFLSGEMCTTNNVPNPNNNWISQQMWYEICGANELSIFSGIVDSFNTSLKDWETYLHHTDPQKINLPGGWEENLSPFQKLILLKILHPDKVISAVSAFITSVMGDKYVQPPPYDIDKSFEDSDITSPLIFILSPGLDPTEDILKYAMRKGYEQKLNVISLGQGQEEAIQSLLLSAQREGKWICLQNCHISTTWLNTLESIWEDIDINSSSPHFRLWLTSCPTDKFPPTLLQMAVKITNETPNGLQQNLTHSYLSEMIKDPAFYNGCKEKDKEFHRLLYALCLFHAVIQERRNFNSLGWNLPYIFNDSDLNISLKQLQAHINERGKIPYDAIIYIVGECNYGGHISDDWDQRVLNAILSDYINEKIVTDQNYKFSSADSAFTLPEDMTYESCLQHIQNLPRIPSPELLGLHNNASMIRDLQDSKMFISSLTLIHGLLKKTESKKSESYLMEKITKLKDKIPDTFDLALANEKYPPVYENSMNIILNQEMEKFNCLIVKMEESLESLQKALNGHISINSPLEELSDSLLQDKLPANWAQVSYPSLKPLGSYMDDLTLRVKFFKNWYENGAPACFWLPGFFCPRAFLTAALQTYSRKFILPVHTLTFDFEILATDSLSPAPDEGVQVNGLYLEGARWDRKRSVLAEQYPKVLHDNMPIISIQIIKDTDVKEKGRYKCPVYKTIDRCGTVSTDGSSSAYIMPILLHTDVPVTHWIKRGTALICQTNY